MREEADYSMTENAHNLHGTNNARFIGDEHALVKFYLHPKKNMAKSKEQGRPIFDEVEYVSIKAGAGASGVARPARDMDRERFPRHYKAFQDKEEMPLQGTPLKEWSYIPRSQVEELKHFDIFTVEQLANAADVNIQRMMGGMTLKQAAQVFLADTGNSEQARKLEEALSERDAKIAELQNTVQNLVTQMEAKDAAEVT